MSSSIPPHHIQVDSLSVLPGRKSWKSMKGKSQLVWPPYLEAALLEALENYRPDQSISSISSVRHPLRNKFISSYILLTTGVRRTPRQVGSRLQQLRDTAGGKELLDSLARRNRPGSLPSSPIGGHRISLAHRPFSDSDSFALSPPSSDRDYPLSPSSSEPDMSLFAATLRLHVPSPRVTVQIDIIRPSASSSSSPNLPSSSAQPQPQTQLLPTPENALSFRSSAPRHLRDIDPTITFISPIPTGPLPNAVSSFSVFAGETCVHQEVTTLKQVHAQAVSDDFNSPAAGCLYSTPLVPGYWQIICDAPDASRYTIVQDIIRNGESSSSASSSSSVSGAGDDEAPILSLLYHFRYPQQNSRFTSNAPATLRHSNSNSHSHLLVNERVQNDNANQLSALPNLLTPLPFTQGRSGSGYQAELPASASASAPSSISIPIQDTSFNRMSSPFTSQSHLHPHTQSQSQSQSQSQPPSHSHSHLQSHSHSSPQFHSPHPHSPSHPQSSHFHSQSHSASPRPQPQPHEHLSPQRHSITVPSSIPSPSPLPVHMPAPGSGSNGFQFLGLHNSTNTDSVFLRPLVPHNEPIPLPSPAISSSSSTSTSTSTSTPIPMSGSDSGSTSTSTSGSSLDLDLDLDLDLGSTMWFQNSNSNSNAVEDLGLGLGSHGAWDQFESQFAGHGHSLPLPLPLPLPLHHGHGHGHAGYGDISAAFMQDHDPSQTMWSGAGSHGLQ